MKRLSMRITRRWPEPAEQAAGANFDVEYNRADVPLSRDALAQALERFDIICPTITDRIDASLLSSVRVRTRALCNFGAGVNHIDLDACRAAGIVVTNTPDVLTDDTADIAMTLALMAARRAGEGERRVRAAAWDGWSPMDMLGTRLTGKTLGVVGFGRIGQALARRAHHGFAMRIVYFSRNRVPASVEAEFSATWMDMEALMSRSDFVSLHMPGGDGTRHMIGADLIARMKPHGILINTARGDVIDEAALVAALAERRIGGAGLDVYAGEPRVSPALTALDNVALLPHLGSATWEARTAMGLRAVANAKTIAAGETPRDQVGQVSAPITEFDTLVSNGQ
jgi:lactate dehydrogenase-like 2-hydroxyacid dehydrogenase